MTAFHDSLPVKNLSCMFEFEPRVPYLNAAAWLVKDCDECLSQAAACDGLVYSVDYNGQNSGTQAHALPLFED